MRMTKVKGNSCERVPMLLYDDLSPHPHREEIEVLVKMGIKTPDVT
jgi:hypothetical protein